MATAIRNLLLHSLPDEYKSRILGKAEAVSLPAGTSLYNPETTPEYAHFLTFGMASVVTVMAQGIGPEIGLIGREGVAEGFHVLVPSNVRTVPTRGVVQVAGTALRMRFADFRREFLQSEPLRNAVLTFVQSQSFIFGQMAACNQLHEVEERLARRLLMAQDRIGENDLPFTQELMAQMLGTRRTSVTIAARRMCRRGLIEYQRGRVKILDRVGTEEAACECYMVTRKLSGNLFR